MGFTVTKGALGNIYSGTIAANGTYSTGVLDYTSDYMAKIQIDAVPTAGPSTTNGCQIDIYSVEGTSSTLTSTVDYAGMTLAMGALNTHVTTQDITLDPGRYVIKLSNLDATNPINVQITDTQFS